MPQQTGVAALGAPPGPHMPGRSGVEFHSPGAAGAAGQVCSAPGGLGDRPKEGLLLAGNGEYAHGHSRSSHSSRSPSLVATTATATNITNMSWLDFQKCVPKVDSSDGSMCRGIVTGANLWRMHMRSRLVILFTNAKMHPPRHSSRF